MTLGQFFEYLNNSPLLLIAFFAGVPLLAFLFNWIFRQDATLSPWNYLYSILVFAVSVPGILVVGMGIYLFLFERGNSLYNLQLLTQVLPVVSMIVTLGIVRRNIAFEDVPGFGKLTSLMVLIVTVLIIMYLLQRLHLIVWINLPPLVFIGGLVILLFAVRFTLKSLMK